MDFELDNNLDSISDILKRHSSNKLKRINLNFEDEDDRKCSCDEFRKSMQEMFADMKETMLNENKVLKEQLNITLEAVSDIKLSLKRLEQSQRDASWQKNVEFPLESEEKLIEINERITEENCALYINTMKTLIINGGVLKNLKYILSDSVAQKYNVDGVQGKKSLKALSKFFGALIESIPTNENDSAEKQLRKALQLQKNRYFKSEQSNKMN